ncbi:unnamed protein product [Meganyctiphanes norvegica]|uniref:Uncharacterized protein n=1 Tax=Meganyctiphanes norvegica TaxID=48144 RepID=A0AAV2SCK5_MEGNR
MLGNWLHLRNLTLCNKKLITLKVRNLETCHFNTISLTHLCTLCINFMNTALIVFPLQLLSCDKNFALHPVYQLRLGLLNAILPLSNNNYLSWLQMVYFSS